MQQNTSQRGCVTLLIAVPLAFAFCFFIPFILLPSIGSAITLPVITVPAEYYRKDWPTPDFELVNTLGGAMLANVLALLLAVSAWRASKGWTQEVPGRLQGFVEVLVGGLWGLAKQQAGNKPKVKNILFPVVASIFLFLLMANWGKLLPGVESVGVMHCAAYDPVPLNGHPIHELNFMGMKYYQLRVDAPLTVGTAGTSKSYYQCNAGLGDSHYTQYAITELDPFLDKAVTHVVAEGDTLASIAEAYQVQAADTMADSPAEYNRDNYTYTAWRDPHITVASVIAANSNEAGELTVKFLVADDEHATEDHATTDSHGEAVPAEATKTLEPGQTIVVRPELFGEKATTFNNQIYTVAPFVRGVSTDLSFTLGLAIMAFFMIQAFGISELGLNYFQKFINVRAIGEVSKRPLALIDFVVGLFEIISEFGKIISLSFRLFGALFAGSLLYAVILFLVGTTIPVIILALELIVGGAQAGVFAVLTLIFCAQAMVSHHHDDEHHGDDGHHAEAH